MAREPQPNYFVSQLLFCDSFSSRSLFSHFPLASISHSNYTHTYRHTHTLYLACTVTHTLRTHFHACVLQTTAARACMHTRTLYLTTIPTLEHSLIPSDLFPIPTPGSLFFSLLSPLFYIWVTHTSTRNSIASNFLPHMWMSPSKRGKERVRERVRT